MHNKDDILMGLSEMGNIAQFVSYAPNGEQRRSCLKRHGPDHKFSSIHGAVGSLLMLSPCRSVNIRTYRPGSPQSCPFVYGLTDPEKAIELARGFMADGLNIIFNETIDVNDGGVSGVLEGGVVEYAPGCTPRVVEGMDVPALPRGVGLHILQTVYGFAPNLGCFDDAHRVEFSVHPSSCGVRDEHTIIWEVQETNRVIVPETRWPNQFSRLIGDKAYGLLMADTVGLPVPRTDVVTRSGLKFTFGDMPRDGGGVWTRTCPPEPVPGKFSTVHSAVDPNKLMDFDDPGGGAIASCLVQRGVDAVASGALAVEADGSTVIIEGVNGFGDSFMQGDGICDLNDDVRRAVMGLYLSAADALGRVRMEWVYDGERAWVVQLHLGSVESCGRVIYPGDSAEWVEYKPEDGLEQLRSLLISNPSSGVIVRGPVGMTSHVADVLRKAQRPARLEPRDCAVEFRNEAREQ